jgi:hypothetical protein
LDEELSEHDVGLIHLSSSHYRCCPRADEVVFFLPYF